MKNKSYIGISFIILVFGILVIPNIVDRIGNNEIVQDDRLNKVVGKKADLISFSKAPFFSFKNSVNEPISNDFYKGKVYLVEFFFTTCPTICPKMNENMKKINEVYQARNDFGIASITITPAYDTQEVLKKYKAKYEITNPNWNFLTGDLRGGNGDCQSPRDDRLVLGNQPWTALEMIPSAAPVLSVVLGLANHC